MQAARIKRLYTQAVLISCDKKMKKEDYRGPNNGQGLL